MQRIIALRLEFSFKNIGKTGRSIFEHGQARAALLALGNVLARSACPALRKFLVREEKKLFVRQMRFAALHCSLTPSRPNYTRERSRQRQRNPTDRDAERIGYLAVLQSLSAQIEAALVLLRKCLEDGTQALLCLAERQFLLSVGSLAGVLGQGVLIDKSTLKCLICAPPFQSQVMGHTQKRAIEIRAS